MVEVVRDRLQRCTAVLLVAVLPLALVAGCALPRIIRALKK